MPYNPSPYDPYRDSDHDRGRGDARRRRDARPRRTTGEFYAPQRGAEPGRTRSSARYVAGARHTAHASYGSRDAYRPYASRERRDGGERYATGGRYAAGERYAATSHQRVRPGEARRRGAARRGQGFQMPQLPGFKGERSGRGGRPGGLGTNAVTSIVGIVVVAVLAIAGILMWSNRSVKVTVNGQSASLRVGSTLEQVIKDEGLTPAAGNLISVSGNKLEDGAGYPYLAKVGGNEMDGPTSAAYRLREGDDLSIEDGRDRTEDYDVQVVEEQPKLEMGGEKWGNLSYVSQWPKVGKYEMRTGRQSGETARGDTIEETKNAVVSIHQIKPAGDRKLVALTFDDGPAEKYTEAYLDILNRYGVHATFFNLGQNIEEYPDLSKKVVEQGSEVMSHTYQHQQLSKLDASALQQEFSSTFAAIKDKVGVDTTSFRPPYGDFTEKAWLNSGGEASVSVLWNQDSLDWKRPGASTIVTNSLKGITSGSIILMHDGGGPRDQDVEALPQIIEQLQGQGYELVTVSELMKSDDAIPEDIANGDAQMPEGSTWPTEMAQASTGDKASA